MVIRDKLANFFFFFFLCFFFFHPILGVQYNTIHKKNAHTKNELAFFNYKEYKKKHKQINDRKYDILYFPLKLDNFHKKREIGTINYHRNNSNNYNQYIYDIKSKKKNVHRAFLTGLVKKNIFFINIASNNGIRNKFYKWRNEKKHSFTINSNSSLSENGKKEGGKSENMDEKMDEKCNGEKINEVDKEKKNRLIDNMNKNYLSIKYVDEKNESSDISLIIGIKSKLREYYYDKCVKEYKDMKLKENKYEYSYLNDVPINNLINYIDKNEYFKIFLKHINEDIIKVYKKMNNLYLIGAPRLLNKIDHVNISKFDDIVLNFSIDIFPTIKFNRPYINLDIIVKVPPYEKGNTFKEFLKYVNNELEIKIDTDENHKVDWNNDVHVNVSKGWVYSFNDTYYDEFCSLNNCSSEKKEEEEEENYENISIDEINKFGNNKISELIDMDKDEEKFINNSDYYNKEMKEENDTTSSSREEDEIYFNNTNDDVNHYGKFGNKNYKNYYNELLKNSEYINYFKEGYQLPSEAISMENTIVSIKENYNPIGFNESLIGMGKNDKKNVTVYLPVNLFQDYFKNQQKKNDGNGSIIALDKDTKKDLENLNEISKDSINKFREIIYMEIKKLKNNKVFDKLESILKSNENKFFDNNDLEKYLKRDETNKDENNAKEEEVVKKTDEKKEQTGEIYYLPNKDEDIEYILGNDNENDEEMESNELENKEANVNAADDELNFKKNFDKYLEEILKENMNSLDKKIPSYNNETSKTKEIFENLCDPNDYDKVDNIDETLNDYILGKSDLIKCVLEVNVTDIKLRKSGTENIDDYIFKKYNKTKDELYTEIENRAMIDIQNKCVEQRRMGAYKKLMEITSLNVPITLFRAQGKKLYENYLKKKQMQGKNVEGNNSGSDKVLTFEEFINKSQREIYDQIKFSFIVKSIFHNSKLKLNYDELIKDVIKTLIKTPTYNIKTIIKQIYTIHQAQCVLDFVSLNSNILHETDNSSSVNFSVSMKKGSSYSKDDFINYDDQPVPNNGLTDKGEKKNTEDSMLRGDKIEKGDGVNSEKKEEKIFNFNDEANFIVEKKKENDENIELEYFTFKKGANYTKYFEEKGK
ncbi:conserved Plasmodium protein, unknown function [Plasmodium chabaudi chabaudi]|uniref:Trigger factor C-terminal domain-containing protein n=1 Tax=Plasmodium chabaudi chabaudi TaxID=31271 RepID=A0A4V0K256_PLACU|nr:conserved Plasmodium protein, unknown function [Plasmodium chabaudi chabaudi]VTZ66520.1 conserved Plasmodium protein, unknown function [Plasmodium chabaudi chabaudi]|eukprot:XP_736964.2 conserved Plasmodium protein, unknown function [Plasmodium chabaudi chabaudi]